MAFIVATRPYKYYFGETILKNWHHAEIGFQTTKFVSRRRWNATGHVQVALQSLGYRDRPRISAYIIWGRVESLWVEKAGPTVRYQF